MSQQNNNPGSNGQPEPQQGKKTYTIHGYFKTGGLQPGKMDKEAINYFFTHNYAKAWAMYDGFMAYFEEYRDGKLIFRLITDPRFKGHHFFLALWVARQFKSKVNLLKEAGSFEALHFKAIDIIGYNIPAGTDIKVIKELDRRVSLSVDTLSAKPDCVHFGKI
ncbi:MAG: hypothetical protein FJY20_06055 [Bacteroidetes bacterium]|nr:hypothetical protein [Bacteroidota bacterium]